MRRRRRKNPDTSTTLLLWAAFGVGLYVLYQQFVKPPLTTAQNAVSDALTKVLGPTLNLQSQYLSVVSPDGSTHAIGASLVNQQTMQFTVPVNDMSGTVVDAAISGAWGGDTFQLSGSTAPYTATQIGSGAVDVSMFDSTTYATGA